MFALVKAESAPGLTLKRVPIPSIGPTDVLIRIKKTSICGTDVHIYRWDEWAEANIKPPLTIGHEYVGIVEAVGEMVKGVRVGERVSGEGHLVCGICRNCRAGKRHLCKDTRGVGVNRSGAFAEYLALPRENVVPIMDGIDDDLVAIFDPLGNAVHTALKFDMLAEDVLITGAGPIGIMAAAVARFAGARHVVLTDINETRLKLAEKIVPGLVAVNVAKKELTDVVRDLKMTEGFDVGLEMSGAADALHSMMSTMRSGGKLALLGFQKAETTIDFNALILRSLTIQGIYGREMFETWYKMMSMIQSGLDVSGVITHRLDFRDYEKGFAAMMSNESGKVILDWTSAREAL
ncbi:MAG TPA: L-threonine 3-dehydrogenase [Clostridiaceae bacterium]|nr:L-threonine 3-dehydrogenase [Clostridiaceae bacterium]